MATDAADIEIVRERDRRRITGLSRVQWWRMEREGLAPRRVRLGRNSVGWIRAELTSWIRARMAQR